MGRAWRDHPSWEVVQDASRLAGRDIAYLLLEAGAGELSETRNAQLATFVMGLVVLDAVERLGIEPTACAGHSLGEYTALVAAGGLGFDDAVRLVSERGEAMQEAAEEDPGIMLALSGVDDETARIACRRADGDVWLANSNGPGECVIAGRPEAAHRAARVARALGATAVKQLAVSGAFHTALMTPAQPRLRKALDEATFYTLDVPVVANVDALPHAKTEEWPSLLSAQLRSPVRWRQSVLALARLLGADGRAGDQLFCELGAGGSLCALVRATAPSARTLAIAAPDDLDTLVATLAGEAAVAPAAHAGHEGERLYLFERLVVSPCAGLFELPPPAVVAEAGGGAGHATSAGGAGHATSAGGGTNTAGARGSPGQGAAGVNPGVDPTTANQAASTGTAAGALPRPIAIGDIVGLVSGTEVRSPFAGELMGVLAHPGERVQPGQPLAWLRSH
jgi:[acyl-carrier-protein] S-malonyltransferase